MFVCPRFQELIENAGIIQDCNCDMLDRHAGTRRPATKEKRKEVDGPIENLFWGIYLVLTPTQAQAGLDDGVRKRWTQHTSS